jgi:hypothetical protein
MLVMDPSHCLILVRTILIALYIPLSSISLVTKEFSLGFFSFQSQEERRMNSFLVSGPIPDVIAIFFFFSFCSSNLYAVSSLTFWTSAAVRSIGWELDDELLELQLLRDDELFDHLILGNLTLVDESNEEVKDKELLGLGGLSLAFLLLLFSFFFYFLLVLNLSLPADSGVAGAPVLIHPQTVLQTLITRLVSGGSESTRVLVSPLLAAQK